MWALKRKTAAAHDSCWFGMKRRNCDKKGGNSHNNSRSGWNRCDWGGETAAAVSGSFICAVVVVIAVAVMAQAIEIRRYMRAGNLEPILMKCLPVWNFTFSEQNVTFTEHNVTFIEHTRESTHICKYLASQPTRGRFTKIAPLRHICSRCLNLLVFYGSS